MNKIAIVILNWNGKELLQKFLPSVLLHSQREWAEVIVADNASNDDSVAFLEHEHPDVKLIKLDCNYGFANGYNKALQQLEHAYFVLLNSDVEVTENWLDPIYRQFENQPKIAAAQPKIKSWHQKSKFEYAGASGGFIDHLGYPFCRGRILHQLEEDEGQYDCNADVFWASGAALFIRAEVYKKLGGLDADFFAHMEEIDLCWRIKNQDYRIVCNPNSIVYHVGGATLPTHHSRKLYLNFRNNLLMLYKNLHGKKLWAVLFIRFFLDGLAALKLLLKGELSKFVAVFKAYISFCSMLGSFREKRKKNLLVSKRKKHFEIYKRSMILDFYLRKKTHFSDLKFE